MIEPTFRPATLDDAELASDLMTAAYPEFAVDPVLTRYRWEHPRKDWVWRGFIAETSSKPIAFVHWLHGPPEQDPERHCEVGVALDQSRMEVDLLTQLWRWATEQAVAGGSRMLEAYAAEDEPEMLEALGRVGYERDRLEKVWELDLGLHGDRLVAEAELERTESAGRNYEITTVARWQAQQKFEALHALDSLTRKDIPTTFPILPETFENFMERLRSPDRPHERWWIAVRDGNPVAMSYLRFPPFGGTCGPATRAATPTTAATALLAPSSCSRSRRRSPWACRTFTPTTTPKTPPCCISTSASGMGHGPD